MRIGIIGRMSPVAVCASCSLLFAILLTRTGGEHTVHLLAERMALGAPEFVQARILVHLAARGIDALIPGAGVLRIYQAIAFLSVMAVLLSFRSLLGTMAGLTHTHRMTTPSPAS